MATPDELPAGLSLDFQLLFDATPIPYLVLTPDFTMVAANEARLKATNTARDQILGKGLFDVFPDNPADPEATGVTNLRASLMRVLQNKRPDAMPIQKYDIPKHGDVNGEFEVRYWKPLNTPVLNTAGEIIYIIHSVEDVTEHILKQQATEESEAKFRQIADAIPQMVWSTLPDGYHDYYNRQHYEFAGVPAGSTLGQSWAAILHPDDLLRAREAWEHSLATGEPYESEYRLRHHSGQYHWVLARALSIRNAAGEIERWMGTCTDINEQKILQAKLQDAQLRLEGALTAAEIGTWTWDIQADRVYADPNFARLFDVPEKIANGGPREAYFHAIHPDDLKAVEANIAEALTTGKPYQDYYRLCQPDGSIRYIHARGKIESDASGKPAWMPGVVLDITQQKLAEEARLRTEFQFKAIVDSNVIGILQYRYDGTLVNVNDAFLRMLGYSREDVERNGLSWRELTPPEWADADRRSMDSLQSRGSAEAYEKEYFRKDGSRLPVYVGAANFHDAKEEGIAYVLDISESKKAQLALKESEVQFRTLAENIPQLAWMANSDGQIFWYNNRWFEYTGTTLEETQGWGWEKVHHPDFVEAVKAKYYDDIVKQQIAWEDLFPLRGKNGEYRWFLSRAVPIRDRNGQIVRWFGTNTDITIQREAEEALELANRRKDEFLAMLAHELRNPLAPISTAAELLKMVSSEENIVKKYSEIIARQVRHMTELVDDLLDVSRVTRGLVSIEKDELSIKEVINSAIEQSRPLIESRNHALSIHLAPNNAAVLGDRTRLIQVLTNLLNNAAKYTPMGGHIALSMEVKETHVCISVADDGIGMDSELLPHVFDLFTQAERTPDRSQGGLGLGLALVRSIMTLHGGSVTARSAGPGKGSVFALSLPILRKEQEAADEFPAAATESHPSRPLNILIVDDNADAAVSLEALLEEQGHVVTVRENAQSALEEAKHLRPEALILDIGLPDMDGYELSRRLHGLSETKDAMYIALTGYGQAHDKILAKAAGFQHYFVKPVDMTSLRRVLSAAG
ncbi:PAS/PAC sensor hybrid histidine kinase [Paucimonas lemoignei]|uniref:histidine kinase n=1 Tax=Paucimonas lemoignei TaxID=29443 RepID=A0A4R3HXJ0_PAULE|nr:PAS domain-containing protein [Paucimonas lemoignei]TCS38026.1 PAS/PAC sensor hybrid histidine kinase [Paucimonas lemoignei]